MFQRANDVKGFDNMKTLLNNRFDVMEVKIDKVDKCVVNIEGAIKAIPQQVLNAKNVSCPYVFKFISEVEYHIFKEEKTGNNTEGTSLDNAENLTSKANALCDELKKLTGEDFKDSKISQGIVSKVRSTFLGARVTIMYLQILDGVTFEPVLSYKVSRKEYPENVQKASQTGSKICNILQNLSFISKTAALMGYPIPDISKAA